MALRASVVIPIYQQVDLTRACLLALERAGLDGVEIVLVDNASTEEGMAEVLAGAESCAHVIRNAVNVGFAAACNLGARAASASVVIFLNTDTEVHEGWLDPLMAAVEDPGVGVAGSRLLYPDGRIQHAGMALMPGCEPTHLHRHAPGDLPAALRTRDLTLLTAACVAVRRDLFVEAGGFDEGYRNGYEDTDLCLRLARDGYVARYCGDSVVTHHEGKSPGRADAEEHNALRFRARWFGSPSDWAQLLAEDGVTDFAPADTLWIGPLFDDSEEAARGRDAVEDLAAAGFRPRVVEQSALPCAPGLGPACSEVMLTALNRTAITGHHEHVFVHDVDGATLPEGIRDGIVPVVVDPARYVFGPAPAMRQPVGWWGPLLGRSGYASAGRALVGAARREGRTVRVAFADRHDGEDPALLIDPGDQETLPHLWVVHHPPVVGPGYRAWEHVASSLGKPFVGAVCFETEGLPDGWVEACRLAEEVWVPTAFNVRTFSEAGVDPECLHAVPYPVDCDIFAPGPERDREGPFTFVSVFEWTWRKGWDVLLRAYVEEFTAREDVELKILTYRGAGAAVEGSIPDQAGAFLASLGYDPEAVADIDLLLHPLSLAQVVSLYRDADTFVLPSRGEGAGMPVLEAMACGTPVIATAWGGHEELMTEEWAFPVEVERMVETSSELVRDNPIYAGLHVAEPSVESLRRQMRQAFDDPACARRRAQAGLTVVRERFDIPAAGRALDARLEVLLGSGARVAVRL